MYDISTKNVQMLSFYIDLRQASLNSNANQYANEVEFGYLNEGKDPVKYVGLTITLALGEVLGNHRLAQEWYHFRPWQGRNFTISLSVCDKANKIAYPPIHTRQPSESRFGPSFPRTEHAYLCVFSLNTYILT